LLLSADTRWLSMAKTMKKYHIQCEGVRKEFSRPSVKSLKGRKTRFEESDELCTCRPTYVAFRGLDCQNHAQIRIIAASGQQHAVVMVSTSFNDYKVKALDLTLATKSFFGGNSPMWAECDYHHLVITFAHLGLCILGILISITTTCRTYRSAYACLHVKLAASLNRVLTVRKV
jgi:hypothetical protein